MWFSRLQPRPGILLGLVFLLLWTAPLHAESLAELQARAAQRQLDRDPYWKLLLHYQRTWNGTERSLIDDPDFFLAEQGKTDPDAELSATLAGFDRPEAEPNQHPQCRFPDRLAWLSEQLQLPEGTFPAVACPEYQTALEKVDPRSVTLIFPGTHSNNPASMFGHTLLNLDGPYESRLLSYAVNYSAQTAETSGFAFAFKGILGLYRGYYSVLPYYEMVRKYNDLERRDVWEYRLNLDREESRRMFRHVWALRDIYSDYYFFDENCSYNLLFLLEAARPGLSLVEECRPWVIPVDTVRIVEAGGLVARTDYRPSKATRIAHLAGRMDGEEVRAGKQLLAGELTPERLAEAGLSRAGEIRVLELAAETVEFRYFRQELSKEEYRREYLGLLTARSRRGAAEAADVEIPAPAEPASGHGSNRFSLAAGWRDGAPFQELRLRPAYHALQDADAGYLEGSQIIFGDLALRYHPRRDRLELQELDVIDIVSISPQHAFFKPVSWKVATGVRQETFADHDQHLLGRLNPGGGFAWRSPLGVAYLFLETEGQLSGRFDDSYALGAGGSLGLLSRAGERWKGQLLVRQMYYAFGDRHRTLQIGLDQTLLAGRSQSLGLELNRRREYGDWTSDAIFAWRWFW